MNKISKKKYASFLIAFITLFFLCLFIFNKLQNNGIHITIKNQTDIALSAMEISYTGIDKNIPIPIINAKKDYNVTINLPKEFTEGTMKLYYYDFNNNKVEYTIIGYLEKTYHRDSIIIINSVTENGILDISIN
ncbi:hypothetical protein [Anaerosporobacter sp.]|uniref:hypothetical protein n=1 Tax=Anaerosporobacter sp. TaxID=1872529 RepID=UPI00286ED0F6|nr:hypothetical protein [Anaerosporobacter sp.]